MLFVVVLIKYIVQYFTKAFQIPPPPTDYFDHYPLPPLTPVYYFLTYRTCGHIYCKTLITIWR